MDRLSSLTSGVTSSDYLARSAYRRGPQGADETSVDQADNQQARQAADQEQTASAASTSLVKQEPVQQTVLPTLGVQAAREVLQNLTPQIAQAPNWKLAEIQPVGERGLLPSSYV